MKGAPAWTAGPAGRRLRYGAVVVMGLGVDLSAAFALRTLADLPLALAAAAGFLLAVLFNYALFELWAFRREGEGFSARRLLKTYAGALGALAVRLTAVFLLGLLPGSGAFADLARLAAAAGLSLAINYLVLARVFRGPPPTDR